MVGERALREAGVLLNCLQLGDSFFPSGLYTLSHGLESFVQAGLIKSPSDLAGLLEDYIVAAIGPADTVAAANAAAATQMEDFDTIIEIDQYLQALKLVYEVAAASRRSGRQLLGVAQTLTEAPVLVWYGERVRSAMAPGNHAVVLGVFSACWGLEPVQAALLELYAFTVSMLGAALRCMRLGHTDAQTILHRLKPTLIRMAGEAVATPYQDMYATAPLIDVMQMHHAQAYVRLFAT